MGDPPQIIEDRVMDWYDIRSGRVMEKHPGMKHCPVANCTGEMDEWMDRWIVGWMDEWIDGWMD